MRDRLLLQKKIRRQHRVRYKLQQHNRKSLCRLSVFKSNNNLYAQIIDDKQSRTLVCMSTMNKDLRKKQLDSGEAKGNNFSNCHCAKKLGEMLAAEAKKAGVKEVIFDRGRYLYHGVIKALGDSAREHGLNF